MENDDNVLDTDGEAPPPLAGVPGPERQRKADAPPEPLLAWEDRWKQPEQPALLAPLNDQHRKALEELLRLLGEMPRVQRSLIWYGASWHWTLQYNLVDEAGKSVDTLCYIVPNPTGPIICVPLSDEAVARLPIRRLHKNVRTGIRAAKRAVALQWAVWTLTASVDVEPLFDLMKRKAKMVFEPLAAKKDQ